MGGQGSGRKPNPIKQIYGEHKVNPTIASNLNLPNYSGIKQEAIKGKADKDLSKEYLKLDGSNANQDIDISNYNLTMGGLLCLDNGTYVWDFYIHGTSLEITPRTHGQVLDTQDLRVNQNLKLIGDITDNVGANATNASEIYQAYQHTSSTGATHTYINQDVTTTGTPQFSKLGLGQAATAGYAVDIEMGASDTIGININQSGYTGNGTNYAIVTYAEDESNNIDTATTTAALYFWQDDKGIMTGTAGNNSRFAYGALGFLYDHHENQSTAALLNWSGYGLRGSVYAYPEMNSAGKTETYYCYGIMADVYANNTTQTAGSIIQNTYGLKATTYGDTGGSITSTSYGGYFSGSGADTNWGVYSYLGNNFLGADNAKTYFGTQKDASIYYDSADLIINTDDVGTGSAKINGLEITKDGFIKPVTSADAAAPNNSIYYSSTQSKLVYKDSGGGVNNLY